MLVQWIEVGQPDERRMQPAAARAEQATFIAYAASTPVWWAGVKNKLTRTERLAVWQLPAEQSQALAALAAESRRWREGEAAGEGVVDGERDGTGPGGAPEVLGTSAGAGLPLTPRELTVLERVAAGESNKLIARTLGLSPHTVKRHVSNIFDKLGLTTRAQAAVWLKTRG